MPGTFRIKGFDGLRALAVVMVWSHHRLSVVNYDGAGVGLFFVLSGFLIVDILHRQREAVERGDTNVTVEIKSFLTRRSIRIFPVYYMFLALIIPAVIAIGDHRMTLQDVFFHVFYLVNFWIFFLVHHWNETTGHLWSLSAEEQFYLLFPLVALTIDSRYHVAVCAIVFIFGEIAYIFHSLSGNPLAGINPLVSFGSIALGGVFVLGVSQRRPTIGSATVLPAVLLLAYVAIPIAIPHFGDDAARIYAWIPMTVLAGALLVSIKANQNAIVVQLLECWPLRSLGKVSYGFYVYHLPLNIKFLSHALGIDMPHLFAKPVVHILDFVMPLCLAILSWTYVEAPLLRRRSPAKSGPHELPAAA